MFFTYTRRELRRRARQASIIALGLALGIGLVITVTALSSGREECPGRGAALALRPGHRHHALPRPRLRAASRGGPVRASASAAVAQARGPRPAPKSTIDNLTSAGLGTLSSADVTIGRPGCRTSLPRRRRPHADRHQGQHHYPELQRQRRRLSAVAAATAHSIRRRSMSVDGVEFSGQRGRARPAELGQANGRPDPRCRDATANVALLSSDYAQLRRHIATSCQRRLDRNDRQDQLQGRRPRQPVGGRAARPDVYIPLARAQALGTSAGKSLKGDVNTIYVPPASAHGYQHRVQGTLRGCCPSTTVTNQNDLAKQLTGSVASASSLASNLGKWLAIAVLAAAFLLASLLTMSAVSRRVREFGTLKALGWTSRRVVGQVVGEAIVIGVIGGIVGVGLGFLGSALVGHFSPTLTASVGPDHRQRHARRCADIHRRRRLRRRWSAAGRRRRRRAAAVGQLPPGAPHADRDRAPERASHDWRYRGGGVAGHRRRPDRRRVRRLAGGPAAAGSGAGEGRMTAAARAQAADRTAAIQGEVVMYKLTGVKKDYQKGRGRRRTRCRASTWRSTTASGSPSRARPATASRPCCRCWAAWTGPPPGASNSVTVPAQDLAQMRGEPGHQGARRVDRLYLPDLQPGADAQCAGERGGRAGAARVPARSGAGPGSAALATSASATGSGTCRRSCPAASSSGSPSPGPWSSSRRCC